MSYIQGSFIDKTAHIINYARKYIDL